MKQYLKIRPFDTLFFRNGKPFSSGEVSWTESSLLPNPSVIWGAVFSMMMSHGLIDNKKLKIGTEEEKKQELDKLKLGRVFLYQETKEKKVLYIPSPLDIYKEKKNIEKYGVLTPKPVKHPIVSNYPTNTNLLLTPSTDETIEIFKDAFIVYSSFTGNDYCFQKQTKYSIRKNTTFLNPDYKVGIKQSNITNTAEESMLYRINSSQFDNDVFLLIEVDTNEDLEKYQQLLLKLGGESRACEVITEKKIINRLVRGQDKLKKNFGQSQYARVYLHHPVIFSNGTGLKDIEAVNDLTVLGACIGKAQKIGGFNVLKNKPKPMQNAVPPGSIYFLKAENSFSYQEWGNILKPIFTSDKYFRSFEILPLKNTQ